MENVKPGRMERGDCTENDGLRPPAIILVEPQLGEISVRRRARWPILAWTSCGWSLLATDGRMKRLLPGLGAVAIIDNAAVFSTIGDAIADLHFLGATTARIREMVKPVATPESAARDIAERSRGGQFCGIMFGRERSGLENDEVALADTLIMAPVNPAFASLNLAQAVLIVGYEWRKLTAGIISRARHTI